MKCKHCIRTDIYATEWIISLTTCNYESAEISAGAKDDSRGALWLNSCLWKLGNWCHDVSVKHGNRAAWNSHKDTLVSFKGLLLLNSLEAQCETWLKNRLRQCYVHFHWCFAAVPFQPSRSLTRRRQALSLMETCSCFTVIVHSIYRESDFQYASTPSANCWSPSLYLHVLTSHLRHRADDDLKQKNTYRCSEGFPDSSKTLWTIWMNKNPICRQIKNGFQPVSQVVPSFADVSLQYLM